MIDKKLKSIVLVKSLLFFALGMANIAAADSADKKTAGKKLNGILLEGQVDSFTGEVKYGDTYILKSDNSVFGEQLEISISNKKDRELFISFSPGNNLHFGNVIHQPYEDSFGWGFGDVSKGGYCSKGKSGVQYKLDGKLNCFTSGYAYSNKSKTEYWAFTPLFPKEVRRFYDTKKKKFKGDTLEIRIKVFKTIEYFSQLIAKGKFKSYENYTEDRGSYHVFKFSNLSLFDGSILRSEKQIRKELE